VRLLSHHHVVDPPLVIEVDELVMLYLSLTFLLLPLLVTPLLSYLARGYGASKESPAIIGRPGSSLYRSG